MNSISINKNRFVWLVLVLLISLALVGAALAAAGNTAKSITDVQTASPQTQVGAQPAGSLPHSPIQTSSNPPEIYSPGDPTGEQMRLQAMSATQAQKLAEMSENQSYTTDAEANSATPALSPSGAGSEYLPGGIVVDTSIYRFFGNINPYAKISITRSGDGAYSSAEADQTGFFWSRPFDGAGAGLPVSINTGDELLFDIDGGTFTYIVDDIPQGDLDVTDDVISGSIPNDTGGTVVTVTLGLYGEPSLAYGLYTAVTDVNGDFSIDFVQDIGPENFAMVDYKVGEIFQRTSFFPENVFLIMQHGMISGYAPKNNYVHATVYVGDSGDIRWEGDVWADYPYGWITFYDVVLDIGDKVVVDFPGGSTEMHYVYSSYFDFSGDDTVSGNMSQGNQEVRLSFLAWDGADYLYHETHTTSDGGGNFTAVFPEAGIRPDTRVDVAIMDPSGAGSYMITGKEYLEVIVDPSPTPDCVLGRVDKPNADLALVLERGGQFYPRDPSRPITSDPGNLAPGGGYCFALWYDFGNGIEAMNFEVGDILHLSTDTWSGQVTVQEIHWSADSFGNMVNGEIISGSLTGEIALRLSQPSYTFFRLGNVAEARAEVIDGGFSVPFNNFDVRAGVIVNGFLYDPVTGFAEQFTERNHFFRTFDDFIVWGHTYIPDEPITLRLLDPDTLEPVYTSTNDIDSDPYSFFFDFIDYPQYPPLQPGIIVEVEYAWSGIGDWQLVYEPVSVDGDVDLNKVYASGQDGMLDLWGGFDQDSFDQMVPTRDSQSVLDTTFFGYDLGWGDSVYMVYQGQYGNRQVATNLLGDLRRVEFWLLPNGYAWLWGTAQPSHQVTIQTSRGDTLIGWPESVNGNFGTDHSTLLLPGDVITVTAGDGVYPVTIVIPDTWANSDSAAEIVSGHIGLPDWQVEIYPWWKAEMTTTVTDADGYFSHSFMDVPPQGRGYIRFTEEVGEANVDAIFHRPFYDLQPSMAVNYAHDWIEGQYDPGYQVWITVTNSLGEIKATAQGETGEIPYWGGETGFATHYNVTWDGVQPDLQVGDFVYLSLGNGLTDELQLGEIGGVLDVDADTLEGYLDIPWLTDPLPVDCGVWVENGSGMGVCEIDPNGGTFTCDFTEVGFDLKPGMDVGVGYYQPDADKVYNVFNEPAPDLRINLWGQGMPASGNNYILEVHYNNDGWATAPGVTIQGAFWGMVYLSDTSGFNHTGTGDPADPIVWDVGNVPVYRYGESVFYVFVQVVNPPGGGVFATADIDSSMDYYQKDEGRKHASFESGITETNESELNIGKWAWTWAPVPGQDFVYAVNVCNNSENPSSEVYITDTLPLSTTLVNWWGQEPGWEQVSASDHELVVKRPTVSGYRCSEVDINVHLSDQAWIDMNLHNEAWVAASSDPNPTDNFTTMDHPVGTPEYNLHIYPNWSYGQFVPGGEIGYELSFANWGNMPMPGTLLTTYLPQGTEFIAAFSWDWSGQIPFTPTVIGDGYLLWDFGTFPNGYNQNIGMRLKIDSNTPVGTPLVLENRLTGEELEYRYDDNVLIYTDSVHGIGPNLRVDKHTNWYWKWEGQLQYELRILNVGTQYLEDPVVIDTYPTSTTVSNCWWNHGPFIGCEVDEANHQVIYYLDNLKPGETASAMLAVDLAPEDIGAQGLAFVNQADISDFEDIAPADNHDEVTSYTGPDVFVRKWLKEGELRAGELITYTVEFGNLNRKPWNGDNNFGSHITETLPAGTTFVEAIGYWDPANPWEPESIDGQEVSWSSGPMWAEQTWTFDLVVQIDEDVPIGTELLNVIEAWGDSPTDVDINPLNNTFEYRLETILYRLLLPLAQRTP